MTAAEALDAAFRADPVALRAIFKVRVACNAELADDPHVIVKTTRGPGGPTYDVGLLGIVNAALDAHGLPRVAGRYETNAKSGLKELVGFCEYRPAT